MSVAANKKDAAPTKRQPTEQQAWQSSPVLAWVVRVLVFALPIAGAWLSIRLLSGFFVRPAGKVGLGIWVAQAGVLGFSASFLIEKVTRRLVPIAALLNMSLVFPDQAPSRFSLALRAGTVRQQQKKLAEIRTNGLADSASAAAEEAIELVTMLGQHDRLTRGHTERVRAFSDLIAQEMHLSTQDREKLAWGSMLHDVGKMAVRPDILNKPGRPTEEEWEILKHHPSAGKKLLEPLESWLGDWLLAASEHHERWDGNGYPAGLSGNDISLAGRITAVADAYDVMTSRRSYKAPMPAEEAREELVRCAGGQFDPDVVRAFLNVSLGHKWRAGPFAWLLELPGVANGISAVPSAVVTSGAVASSVIVSAVAVGPLQNDVPEQPLAFESAQVIESTTSTSTATTTTAIPIATTTSIVVPTSTSTEEPTTTTATTATTATPPEQATTTGATTPTTPATTTTNPPTTTTSTTQATTTTAAPVQAANFANADHITLESGKNKKINLLDNDTVPAAGLNEASLTIVSSPQHAVQAYVHDGHVHYESEDDYEGVDRFTYRICDNNDTCSTALVTVTLED